MRSSGGIAAIAQVHGSLHQGGTGGSLEFAGYLRELCRQLADSFLEAGQGRVGLEVEAAEPVRVDVDRAIPLGLIVNELVTNAFKHGFREAGAAGTVRVRFQPAGGDAWRLEVLDEGAPWGEDEAAGELRAGLGMQLVEGFARQLHGTVTVERRPRFRVRVEFPLRQPEAGAQPPQAQPAAGPPPSQRGEGSG